MRNRCVCLFCYSFSIVLLFYYFKECLLLLHNAFPLPLHSYAFTVTLQKYNIIVVHCMYPGYSPLEN